MLIIQYYNWLFLPNFFPSYSIVQFEVTHLIISVPRAFFSFCHRKLHSSIPCIFFKYESKIEPGPSQLTPLMQLKIKGVHSAWKLTSSFTCSLLIKDHWSFPWADKTIGKECGSYVSSQLLGRKIAWWDKNSREGD